MGKILPRTYDYAGVYMIKNITNKKVYIGSSRNIEQRLQCHRNALRSGTHRNKALQEDFNKHHQFRAFVLHVEAAPRGQGFSFRDRQRLYALEWKFIEQYDAINTGYNQLGISEITKKAI